MRFTKMEGLGNDYIYVNCLEGEPGGLPELAVRLSDRHFGVGADGLICIKPGRGGDFSMEMYNADGTRGAMCGNGIRCVGKYVYEKGLTRKSWLTIDTDAGPRRLELMVRGGKVEQVTVDMGQTIADGLRVSKAESINYELIRDNVDTLLTLEENWIEQAVREMAFRAKVVAEPSGCVGIAAALAGKIDTSAGKRLIFLITGGNVDGEFYSRLLRG